MAEVAEDPRSAAGGASSAGILRDARTPPKSWSDFEPPAARWANPFVLRVGQVFTGFGVGCGVGIGVGRPVNLGALPAAGAVASMAGDFNRLAASAAAPLRPLLRRLGVRHVDVGVGCGVGFGHGFGAGVALKPQVLASLLQSAQAVASRLISHIPQEHRSHATVALSSSMPALNSSSIPALSNSIPALTGAAEKIREGHNVAVDVVGSERVASESYPGTLRTDSGASGTYVDVGTSSDSPFAAANRAGGTGNSGPGGAYLADVDQAKAQNLIMLSLLEQQADIRRLTQQVQALQEQQHQEPSPTAFHLFQPLSQALMASAIRVLLLAVGLLATAASAARDVMGGVRGMVPGEASSSDGSSSAGGGGQQRKGALILAAETFAHHAPLPLYLDHIPRRQALATSTQHCSPSLLLYPHWFLCAAAPLPPTAVNALPLPLISPLPVALTSLIPFHPCLCSPCLSCLCFLFLPLDDVN
ncbi:unnamed protein product, partial [Closterium sp. Naga37s-1]